MKRSRFGEAQVIGILKEPQAGMSAADLCRKRGISDAAYQPKRLRFRLDESSVAGQQVNVATLKEMLGSSHWSAIDPSDNGIARISNGQERSKP